MAAVPSLSKTTLLALLVFAVLNLHGAVAQNSTCQYNNDDVPGFGIAMVVLSALLLAASLGSCAMAPFLCGKCQGGSSQSCCRN